MVLDNNILGVCSTDVDFLTEFKRIFKNCNQLLDPIVKFEFLKGTQTNTLFKKKENFLEFNEFYNMPDHQDIYKRVYSNALDIARIYSHHEKPNIKTGDVLIMARLVLYPDYYFLTLDKNDFTSLLFDRVGVVTIEHNTPNNKTDTFELVHVCILKFNSQKFILCKEKLKKK